VDAYVTGTLGMLLPTGSIGTNSSSNGIYLVHRRQLGSAVHIFSHIRQTLHAEECVLLAPSLEAVCGSSTHIAAAVVHGSATVGVGGSEAAREQSVDESCGAVVVSETAKSGKLGKRRREHSQRSSEQQQEQLNSQQSAAAKDTKPGMRWVPSSDMLQQGLTGGVRKVLQLSLK